MAFKERLSQGTAVLATSIRASLVVDSLIPVLSVVHNDSGNDAVCGAPPLGSNTHSMITRAKVGVFKPRVLNIELEDREPRNIIEAFASSEWRKAT